MPPEQQALIPFKKIFFRHSEQTILYGVPFHPFERILFRRHAGFNAHSLVWIRTKPEAGRTVPLSTAGQLQYREGGFTACISWRRREPIRDGVLCATAP